MMAHVQSRLVQGVIVANDVGTTQTSITNDAMAVTAYLVEQFGDRLIIYRDSSGNFDQLQHVKGRFIGFGFLHSKDQNQAIDKVLKAAPENGGQS